MRKANIRMMSKDKNRLAASMNQKFEKLHQASAELLLEEANITMKESVDEVPYDTGTLASIAEVTTVKVSNTSMSVKFGYGVTGDAYNSKSGMFASEYMMVIHEDLEMSHPHGKAKFFEDPLNRAKIRIANRIKNVGKKVLK